MSDFDSWSGNLCWHVRCLGSLSIISSRDGQGVDAAFPTSAIIARLPPERFPSVRRPIERAFDLRALSVRWPGSPLRCVSGLGEWTSAGCGSWGVVGEKVMGYRRRPSRPFLGPEADWGWTALILRLGDAVGEMATGVLERCVWGRG